MRRYLAGQSGVLGQVLAWLIPAAVAAGTAFDQSYRFNNVNYGGDAILFVHFGQVLLSSHWTQAFSHSDIQVGPLTLLFFGSLHGREETIAIVLAVATALLVVVAARAAGVRNAVLLAGAGVMAVVTGVTRAGYSWGHPADAMLPLMWIIAADQARRDHKWRAGLLIGLCAGLETWGILGVAVFAFAPRLRDAAVSTLVAAGTALALFLPFMLGGHFEMLSFAWHVAPPSPLSMILPEGTPFGWPLRLLQATVAIGAGVAVARFFRHSPHAIWAAPLAIVAVRLLLDPQLYSYYLAAPKAVLLVGAAVGAAHWTGLPQRQSRVARMTDS
jgi:hypothetical protein